MIHKLGYGAWEELKASIRANWRFRFDWFVKSRTPAVSPHLHGNSQDVPAFGRALIYSFLEGFLGISVRIYGTKNYNIFRCHEPAAAYRSYRGDVTPSSAWWRRRMTTWTKLNEMRRRSLPRPPPSRLSQVVHPPRSERLQTVELQLLPNDAMLQHESDSSP